jgi:rubrerythrin
VSPHKVFESLKITNPELCQEWDYDKNGGLTPEDITRTYKKKIWWKCKEGHTWEASVSARARKKHPTGCPYCAHQLPITGENDFATLFPELLQEWDYEENNLDPTKLTAYSGKRVHWKCPYCGHKWETSLHNRTTSKHSCPNCSMKTTSFGEQAFFYYIKKVFPTALNRYRDKGFELDIYIPEINTGIEFDGYYYHNDDKSVDREKKKYNKCQQQGVRLIRVKDSRALNVKGTSDYTIAVDKLHIHSTLNNAIRIVMAELDPASNMWTRKTFTQYWSSIDPHIDVDKDFFDILADKQQRAIENSFLKEKPELIEDWDYEGNKGVNPYSLTKGCGFAVNWICRKCGYKWQARIPDRLRGDKCPCCNRSILVKGVNDFATLYPAELKEWNYDKNTICPDEVISYRIKYWWKCQTCDYEWQATIHDKVIREDKTGCPKCARKIIGEKRHARAMKNGGLFTKHPELLKVWDFEKNEGIDIYDIASGSGTLYWWKCPYCGNSWQCSPNNKSKGHGCPKCRKKV